jgi:hypothetical protein
MVAHSRVPIDLMASGSAMSFKPGVAGSLDDVVVGFEDAVRKPVRAYVLPDVLDRV